MAIPVISKPATQTTVKNSAITPLTVSATETPTEISATGLPTGLSIAKTGAKIGEITGTPTKKESPKVKLSAKNGSGSATEVEFEWKVTNLTPVVTKPASQTNRKEAAISTLSIASTEEPSEYKATGLPTGLSVNSGTGAITGEPSATGTFEVKISAKNETGTSAVVEFFWNIGNSATFLEEQEAARTTQRKAVNNASWNASWGGVPGD